MYLLQEVHVSAGHQGNISLVKGHVHIELDITKTGIVIYTC